MIKRKITQEELIAGALLKFDRLDLFDIEILKEKMEYDGISFVDLPSFDILEFIKEEKGVISLVDFLKMNSDVASNPEFGPFSLSQRLQNLMGETAQSFFESLDSDEIVLRKFDKMKRVAYEDIVTMFSEKQRDVVADMKRSNFIASNWKDDTSKELYLTKSGEVELYIKSNKNEINEFMKTLNVLKCNAGLFHDYLIHQELDESLESILNVEKYDAFCKMHDVSLHHSKTPIRFERIDYFKAPKIGDEKMSTLLTILDDDHCICIGQVNQVFVENEILNDKLDITHLDWNDLRPQPLFGNDKNEIYFDYNCEKAFDFVHEHLFREIDNLVRNGRKKEAIRYLVILEESIFKEKKPSIVRGIVRGDINGYSIAFNPEFLKTVSKNSDKQNKFQYPKRMRIKED